MNLEMVYRIFEAITSCDRTEAMTVALAALQQASNARQGETCYSSKEEFAEWFGHIVQSLGKPADTAHYSLQGKTFIENECMHMSAG